MKFVRQLLASVACVAAVSSVSAAPVTVTFDQNIFNGSGFDAVQLKYRTSPTLFTLSNVAAGRFQGTVDAFEGVPESIFVDGLSNLYAYCYDIYQDIHGGATVHYTLSFDSVFARTLDFLGAVNTVLSGAGAYNPYAWLHPANGSMGAAIQVGIWESKYDATGWSLTSGDFRASQLDAATASYYDSFVAALDGSDALDNKYVMVMQSPAYQDMIVGDPPPNDVPEPSTLLLAGGALVALATAQRRRKRSR